MTADEPRRLNLYFAKRNLAASAAKQVRAPSWHFSCTLGICWRLFTPSPYFDRSRGNPMTSFRSLIAMLAISGLALVTTVASADSIRLTNGDVIRGRVVSLDDQQLVIESENFGKMMVPRKKVELIGLGEKPIDELVTPRQTTKRGKAAGGSGSLPSLQNPQVQSQLNRLMQEALGGGMGDMQRRTREASEGLKDLQKDLGPSSSADALDGYIKMFELFGGGRGSQPDVEAGKANEPEG